MATSSSLDPGGSVTVPRFEYHMEVTDPDGKKLIDRTSWHSWNGDSKYFQSRETTREKDKSAVPWVPPTETVTTTTTYDFKGRNPRTAMEEELLDGVSGSAVYVVELFELDRKLESGGVRYSLPGSEGFWRTPKVTPRR